MSFESPLFQKWFSSKKEREKNLYERARESLETIFDESQDNKERIERLLKKLEIFSRNMDEEILSKEEVDRINSALLECEDISDKKQFLDKVMVILKPILEIKERHPDKVEEAQTQSINEEGGYMELNRLVSYGRSGNIVHIHASPGRTVENKITLYRQAMKDLARIVDDDPGIEEIIATSHIVAEHPGIFTRAGFKVGELSDELKRRHFMGEEREVKIARIDREDFLRRFLN